MRSLGQLRANCSAVSDLAKAKPGRKLWGNFNMLLSHRGHHDGKWCQKDEHNDNRICCPPTNRVLPLRGVGRAMYTYHTLLMLLLRERGKLSFYIFMTAKNWGVHRKSGWWCPQVCATHGVVCLPLAIWECQTCSWATVVMTAHLEQKISCF
jgi:hypothetical protein